MPKSTMHTMQNSSLPTVAASTAVAAAVLSSSTIQPSSTTTSSSFLPSSAVLQLVLSSPYRPFFAGATGGCVAAILTCPLEIIKTRLQTFNSRAILSAHFQTTQPTARHAFAMVLRHEGPFGFWRGLTPSLVGVLPARAIFFGTYARLKQEWVRSDDSSGSSSRPGLNFVCASLAGSLSATLTCPIWVIRTRLQLMPVTQHLTQQSLTKTQVPMYRFRDVARSIYSIEGPRAFFKGLSASYWGVTEGACQLMLYEELKRIVEPESSIALLGLAALAKLIAAALTYPHEVVRTRLRDQRTNKADGRPLKYQNMIQSIKLIAKEEGLAGLYGGMGPHLMKVVPNAAIMYCIVETINGLEYDE